MDGGDAPFCLISGHHFFAAPHRALRPQFLGWYNPLKKETSLDAPAIKRWLDVGAQPSETVGNLLVKALIMPAGAPRAQKPPKEKEAEGDDKKKKKK